VALGAVIGKHFGSRGDGLSLSGIWIHALPVGIRYMVSPGMINDRKGGYGAEN
jgi:hypothetical protein